MAKASKENQLKPSLGAVDLDPDAWPKFEALIKSAAKMGPKPHEPKKKPKRASKPGK